jgi:hypothetical protein
MPGDGQGPQVLRGGIDAEQLERTLLKCVHRDSLVAFASEVIGIIYVSAFKAEQHRKKDVEARPDLPCRISG